MLFKAYISVLIVLYLYTQLKKMTFAKIFMISLIFYKGLINCQPNPGRVDFRNGEFFNHKITVDYSSCEHSFYEDEEYDQSEDEGYEYEYDDYGYEICSRYNVFN